MADTMTCEVCEVTAAQAKHPCRFEKACDCWRGKACATAQIVRFRSAEWSRMFGALADAFGDAYLALTLAEQNCIIRDCTEDGGVSDLAEYRRSIGERNLASYARTQASRFQSV